MGGAYSFFVSNEATPPPFLPKYVPALFLCYLVPGLWSSAGVYVGADNELYKFASGYLLAPILVWLCLACDIKGIIMLGWRPIVMFFVGTFGVFSRNGVGRVMCI